MGLGYLMSYRDVRWNHPGRELHFACYAGGRRVFAGGKTVADAVKLARERLGCKPERITFQYFTVPESDV